MFVAMQDDVVRCDVDPFLPPGWKKWDTHKTSKSFSSNSNRVILHQCKMQETQRVVKLRELIEGELAKMSGCNANVLDYYFNRPRLIPREWRKWCIFFPGTVYRSKANFPVVRFLYFDEDGLRKGEYKQEEDAWCWGYHWIEALFRKPFRFAVLKPVSDRLFVV